MAAEFAPAEFAQELVDVAGQGRALGCGKARGVPDLPRADLAEAQMRREPGRAAAIGPVALGWHSRPRHLQEMPSSRCCAASSPGVQLSRKPAGPVRLRRLEAPVFERIACEVRSRTQRRRRGQRLRRIAQRLHPPPERREYPQAPAVLVTDVGGSRQQIAGKALRGDADLLQRRGDLIGHRLLRRLRDLVPEHRAAPVVRASSRDDPGGRALAQHQRRCRSRRGASCSARSDCASHQRAAPPSGRAHRRARCFVEHVKADHRPARLRRGMQGGMIGEAQIVAKPDDAGRGGFAGHRAVNSEGAHWVRRRNIAILPGLMRT